MGPHTEHAKEAERVLEQDLSTFTTTTLLPKAHKKFGPQRFLNSVWRVDFQVILPSIGVGS